MTKQATEHNTLYCEDCGNDQDFSRAYVVVLTQSVSNTGIIGKTVHEEEFEDGAYYHVFCDGCGSTDINIENSQEA